MPKAKGGTRTKAKRYLEDNVPDFDPNTDYYCGINPLTPTTAIRWAEVKGDKDNPIYHPSNKNGSFQHERYLIVKFGENDKTTVVTLEGEKRNALVDAFEKKWDSMKNSGRNLNLSRVNINESIGT